MSSTSTLTIDATWKPIFAVTSTGYINLSIQENFVGGRQAVAELGSYNDSAGNFVTTLVDCRGFTFFDQQLPGSFSLDGTIVYNLRLTSNIFEISTNSGSYSVTFAMLSASQQLVPGAQGARGPQGPQGTRGDQGVRGAQGIPGIVQNTAMLFYSSSTNISLAPTYLLPSGTSLIESETQRIIGTPAGGNILRMSVWTSNGSVDPRVITLRINGVSTSVVVTLGSGVLMGDWTGSVPYSAYNLISILSSNAGSIGVTLSVVIVTVEVSI